jgi:serine/threonine protein kinase
LRIACDAQYPLAPFYSVIIDFGFAKYVPDPKKTFTLCGTPLYLPPEVILNRGHNGSADHWSLGILIFEMLTGDTPFYKSGMGQMDLFRAIVKCNYTLPKEYPKESGAGAIISEFLNKNPAKRLGSLANGEEDIVNHQWFKGVIDFDELRRKTIPAPRVPQISNPLDSSNFEDWSHLEDKTKIKFPKLPPEQTAIFDNF